MDQMQFLQDVLRMLRRRAILIAFVCVTGVLAAAFFAFTLPPRYQASARLEAGRLYIDTDWAPGPVRHALLAAKAAHFWRPWIAHLAAQNLLPPDWEEVLRLALFLCPTLVMNLRTGATTHNPVSSLVGLSVAVMAGSEPVAGEDAISRFFDMIDPDRD